MLETIFFHGELIEEVYMQQPQAFFDAQYLHYACKLYKSLYGLKQAPRVWFECFTFHLLTLGFVASLPYSPLFVRAVDGSITYLLLYMDDIIVTGIDPIYINHLIAQVQI